ncbi:MAG: ATP-binding protein, partial [Bacilli bacterium]|nr:ATP-binding protein [Bacilli bacterium]
MGKLVAKIVLTGGPCAGKTTTITKVEEHLIERGYHVLVLNECATEMIKGGIRPFGDYKATVYDFENEILNLQLYKEKRYKDFIEKYDDDAKVVILYDRGSVDIKAYLGEDNYNKILKENHLKNEVLLNEYDLVIHMTTVAKEEENKYSNASNKARFEEAKEAIDLD